MHRQFLGDRLQKFGPDDCFLCGVDLSVTSGIRTEEHIFPKWLLQELNLWDESITQLDGRIAYYRRLKVPCCQRCNGEHLSRVEARVKDAYLKGLSEFRELDRRDLFVWLGKIYYGIIYRESLVPRSVRDQSGERLVPSEHLETFSFHHFLLQAVADRVDWFPRYPGPASFHFFECLDHKVPGRRFDYLDDLDVPMLAIRIGRIGVVCVLQDWGRSENVQQVHVRTAKTMRLHPTQFREVYGRLKYLTDSSWKDNIHPVVGAPQCATVFYNPSQEFCDEVDPEEQAHALATVWGVPWDSITQGGMSISTICDMSGSPLQARDHDMLFPTLDRSRCLWPLSQLELPENWETLPRLEAGPTSHD